MRSRPPRMAPSPRHSGVRRISGLIPDSTIQVRVGAHGSSNGPTHDPSPYDRLSSFSIHYTNIRGLNSNFSSVESHLATSSPNLFLLSETQLSSQSSPDPFQISHYNLFSRFRYKGGICAYCNINTPIARLMDLESPHFDVLWLIIYLPTTTIFLCFCYCSPNATNFPSFFEYLTSCHESLLSSHPQAEVLYIGNFNVHHTDWLKSTHTDVGGIEAFHFSISNELEQIIKHPTRVPDRHDHATNPLDLFFTSNPQNYTYTVSSPLGSSDHCTVSVTSTFTPPPPIPPTQRHLWHFENARRADMSNFLFDFPWDDYCFRTRDPDLAATAVGEVMDSGMRAYIPYSLITFSPSKPWFDRACSSAISDREGAHRSYQASPSELTHATFISARNRCSAKKGDRSNPSNYCPIALTSAVAKVFETLLNSVFIKHLKSNNLLSDHQYGFRKARSTGDLLSYLTHVWSSSLKNFGESFVIALDISKAFDRVWHKALLAKLPAYGFTPSFCKLISNFFSNRFISVVVDGATSASFPVSSGVPQGSVLSPTRFLLFINDLLHATASDIHSFADDSNLHKFSSFQCQPSSNARSQSRLACLQLLTQICRAFPSGELVIQLNLTPPRHSF